MDNENRLTCETPHSSSIAHRLISPQGQVLECSPFSCTVCVHVLSTLNSQGCLSQESKLCRTAIGANVK